MLSPEPTPAALSSDTPSHTHTAAHLLESQLGRLLGLGGALFLLAATAAAAALLLLLLLAATSCVSRHRASAAGRRCALLLLLLLLLLDPASLVMVMVSCRREGCGNHQMDFQIVAFQGAHSKMQHRQRTGKGRQQTLTWSCSSLASPLG